MMKITKYAHKLKKNFKLQQVKQFVNGISIDDKYGLAACMLAAHSIENTTFHLQRQQGI